MSSPTATARLVLWTAGVAGAATLVVELGAVRLMAPWFGTSAGVWTNVIGVILLALALGYLLGASLAARVNPRLNLAWVLLVAAGVTAWLPALAHPVCSWFLPAGVSLDSAASLWLWGSLAATLILFLPAALVLGCVGPLAVECVAASARLGPGRAGGRVLAASTLGSLVGTFATTHVLIPGWGIDWSFFASASVLFVHGAWLALGAGRKPTAACAVLVLATLGVAFGASRLRRPEPAAGVVVLAQRESAYQSLRVVEDGRWGEPVRLLQVNEGLDSFQSAWREQPGLLGAGFYYDLFALPAWWTHAAGELGPRWKVLVLGLGAGTTFRVLEGASPPGLELELWGVEIDPEVIELGRAWFELDPGHRVIAGQDGRAALRGLPRDFDLIVLDAYAHQVEIPAHLATLEALSEMRAHLAPRGWLAINVGGFGFTDPVVGAVGNTLARVFPGACSAYRVPRSRNFVLFARDAERLATPRSDGWWFEGDVGAALLPALSMPSMSRPLVHDPSATWLVDDRCPLDRLQRQSLEQARERLVSQS